MEKKHFYLDLYSKMGSGFMDVDSGSQDAVFYDRSLIRKENRFLFELATAEDEIEVEDMLTIATSQQIRVLGMYMLPLTKEDTFFPTHLRFYLKPFIGKRYLLRCGQISQLRELFINQSSALLDVLFVILEIKRKYRSN